MKYNSNIESIGDYAFAYSKWVSLARKQEITFPSTLRSIGNHSFEGIQVSSGKSTLLFPQTCSIVSIPDYAFYNMNDCVDVAVLSPLISIGNYAFYKDFGVYSTEKAYPASTFAMDYLAKANLSAVEYIGEYAGVGCIFNVQPLPKNLTTIPTGFITRGAYMNDLPDTVTTIKPNAFTRKIVDFKLPDSLNDIAIDAFTVDTSFIVNEGSYAELWASENGFGYSIEGGDNMDWLNN